MAYDLYPAVDENYNFPPEVRQALSKSPELRYLIVPMSTTERNNLQGEELWDGRLILNTDTNQLNQYEVGVGWGVFDDPQYLKLAGGTMTGRLILKTFRETRVNHGLVSGTVSLDLWAGTVHAIEPNAATTIEFVNFDTDGDSINLRINAWTVGFGSITWPTVSWKDGEVPILDANAHHWLTFWRDAGVIWGAHVGAF